MSIANPVAFLRRVLIADVVLSALMALLLITAASVVASLTALPDTLLQGTGWVLVPWVALLLFVVTRKPLRAGWVWLVAALNALWVLESVVLLFLDSINANALGILFVLGQAAIVAVFAALQTTGARVVRLCAGPA
jgi:hypothetical protein